jgi:hypothetical protein
VGTWIYTRNGRATATKRSSRKGGDGKAVDIELTDTDAGARLTVLSITPGAADYETKTVAFLRPQDERRILRFLLDRWAARLEATLESEAASWRSPVWAATLEAVRLLLSLIGRVRDIHDGTANPKHTALRLWEILRLSGENLDEIQDEASGLCEN